MTVKNESTLSSVFSKITRSTYKETIYNLFIFKNSGLCIYSKNFSNSKNSYRIEEKQLFTAFIAAFNSFTKEIMGKNIKVIEIEGGIKFILIKKNNLYYVLLCDSNENLTLIETIISKIDFHFIDYINRNNININTGYVSEDSLNQIIDNIIEETFSCEFDLKKEAKIIESLKEMSLNDDIKGIILLTDKGRMIYTSLETKDIKKFLNEVEFRVKICNNSILTLFYTSKNNEIIFSEYVEDLYFVILVFDSNIKYAVAKFYLQQVVKFMKNIIKRNNDMGQ